YVSQTRLSTSGELVFEDKPFAVSGNSWFDHEWSSEAMAEGLAGWDWFSLQFEDNTELMLYLLRYDDGRLEPASSGSYINAEGSKTDLVLDDFSVEPLSEHRSPRGVVYPSRWKIKVPSLALELEVKPRMADQEMTSGVLYWEGAVTVQGKRGESELDGVGFVELTGY
ncbi:MAG TPA: carotenoid 1,2-hydratase, partial [Phycisphaerales bacterium]|nr:carotenoid 1,2-hydratase [Phycisphaerales bacterium]